jgi:TonB family protein
MHPLVLFFLFQTIAITGAVVAGQSPKHIFATLSIDYPTKALAEGREGTVQYQLLVGKNGKAKSCVVTKSSGHADLDKAACKTMTRKVRFSPALEKKWKADCGYIQQPIEFSHSTLRCTKWISLAILS